MDHPYHPSPSSSPPPFSLARRLQLCVSMLAVESYISFEEIFMLPMLQRTKVPVTLVSLPGTISSIIGIFVIPLLGWGSDKWTCCPQRCGQKRPFAVFTLLVSLVGMGLIVLVSWTSLYDYSPNHYVDGEIFSKDSDSTPLSLLMEERDKVFPSTSMGGTVDVSSNTSSERYSSQFTYTAKEMTSAPTSWLGGNASAVIVSETFVYPQSTPAADNSGGNVSSGEEASDHMNVMSVVAITGFVLSDHGYDSSMSTLKAYMVSVTPASQHDHIFILGTLIGAVGGCLTSLLGFVDLASLFPVSEGEVLDEGKAQCLVQALIIFSKLLVLTSVTLMTGTESRQQQCHSSHQDGLQNTKPVEDTETVIDDCDNDAGDECDSKTSSTMRNSHLADPSDINEKAYLISEPSEASCFSGVARFWRRWKRRVFLCVMTFLGLSTNYSYFVYVSNYVAQVIYDGDPSADSASQDYLNYVDGVHTASLGMLTFYCLFVLFNLFHQKILGWIGLRVEYLLSSVVCAALMVTLAATDSIVVFFLNAISMATYRATVYTVPFILSNNLAKQEAKEANGDSAHSSGIAMATISAMIPGSYLVVSLIMGPLMAVSGYPGFPIIVAAGACVLGIVSAAFVQFA